MNRKTGCRAKVVCLPVKTPRSSEGERGDYQDKIFEWEGNTPHLTMPAAESKCPQSPQSLPLDPHSSLSPFISNTQNIELIMESKPTGNLSIGILKLPTDFGLLLIDPSDGIHVDMEHLKKGEVK